MSSYLSEVLSSFEKMEIEQINNKLPEITTATEECKHNVLAYLENVYVRFLDRPRHNKTLAGKVENLQSDIKNLLTNAEQLNQTEIVKTRNTVQEHLDTLKHLNVSISLVSTICNFHEKLSEINELQNAKLYLTCMQTILDLEKSIKDFKMDEFPVVKEMTISLITKKNALLNTLSNIFKDSVILKPGENKSVMKILNASNEEWKEILAVLYYYKSSVALLDKVTVFLWNHIFVPVVDTTTEVKVHDEDGYVILEVITVDPNKKSSYAEVFGNIKTILQFLYSNFHINLSDELTTLDYVGRDIRDNLSELIIKHCLQDTIPLTKEGLQQYKVVIEATEDLEKMLVKSKIFAADTTSILEYANNIDVLFINKKCQAYVIEAEDLMKKDLHDLVEVGKNQMNESGLNLTTDFPHCCVSRNVIDLLEILNKILEEAITSSEICAGRLFCTLKSICQKYVNFVPEYHKKLLQTIPQQVALFYNNCIYISHKLTEWSSTYLEKFSPVLGTEIRNFDKESHQLVKVASEKFNSYVDSQTKQIEETMKEAGLQKQALENLEASTEKCVRQCLRQQELLKTVWHKVLPYNLYNKTLGDMLNSLCLYLINAIVKFEDISSDAADQLAELFKMILTRGPKLFTDPKEVSLFVASWYKMNELAFVLSSNLLGINDRWTDGKGPLALQFTPGEMRQLIRALFQNTENRAALLAKVHD